MQQPPPIDDRDYLEGLYQVFRKFMLEDQRKYYQKTMDRYETSAKQVNTIRAGLSLLTGIAAALVGLIVVSQPYNQCFVLPLSQVEQCGAIRGIVMFLMVVAIVAPALGGAFGTLADLYQWDRVRTIYQASLENIGVANAFRPDPDMDQATYRASLRAYTEGTLNVMRDESAQWGQLIRTPEQLDRFIAEETAKQKALAKPPLPPDAPPSTVI